MNRTVAFVVALLAASQAVAVTPSFTRLGHFPGGYPQSESRGISSDGSVVVGYGWAQLNTQAFRWTAGDGLVALGDLPGGHNSSTGTSASADGQVVVGYSNSANNPAEAFRWTPQGGMVGLGALPGAHNSFPISVSGDGNTVVGYAEVLTPYEQQAFRWNAAEGMTPLSGMPAGESFALDVSFDGSVIVGHKTIEIGLEAFRWTATDGPVGLGYLHRDHSESVASAVTPDGAVVVGTSRGGIGGARSFRWTMQGGMTDIGDLGTADVWALGVSDDGKTIVGVAGFGAFIWTESGGMRDLQSLLTDLGLDLGGFKLTEAIAVSADGTTIVGNGRMIGVIHEAWVATIPEPSTIVLVTLAIVVAMLTALARSRALAG